MKLLSGLLLSFGFAGSCFSQQHVDFVYFNLSTNEIKVTIVGIPRPASPGILVPVRDENNPLNEVSSTFFKSVNIGNDIKVKWQEAGTSHEVAFKRSELELPAKMSQGKVRFTYLGNNKWRIRLLDQQKDQSNKANRPVVPP